MSKTVFVLSIGVINIQTGKTMYDWSIYDHSENSELYLTKGFLMIGAKGSLQTGDVITLINNDTQRKVSLCDNITVKAVLSTNKETLVKQLFDLGYDYRVLRAFAKKSSTRKLSTSYSIKGIE